MLFRKVSPSLCQKFLSGNKNGGDGRQIRPEHIERVNLIIKELTMVGYAAVGGSGARRGLRYLFGCSPPPTSPKTLFSLREVLYW